jgi:putative glutamine amidotransferase
MTAAAPTTTASFAEAADDTPRLARIAVAPRTFTGDTGVAGAWRKPQAFFERTLLERLTAAGALVIGTCLPREPRDAVRLAVAYAAQCDGLVLQGGSDIASADRTAGTDRERDRFERSLVESFLQLDKPVLGICRGMQLVNVALGGSLAALSEAQAARHSDPPAYDTHEHAIDLVETGCLAALYGVHRGCVNTAHRQTVARLASVLEIEATSVDDGSIEAFRSRAHRYAIGVQWHPEFDHGIAHRLDGDRLLRDFVATGRVR